MDRDRTTPALDRSVASPTASAPAVIPWHISALLVAATSAVVGVIWDISWHRSIGRDTFWTPAHMAIYLSGLLASGTCGWLVLKTTFAGTPDACTDAVRFWGFRGPLGGWLCIWGAFAMITSAPLDNWWHNAYGLDVKVLSPPHVILALGIWGIQLGTMLIVLALQNRAQGTLQRAYGLMFLFGGGILLQNVSVVGIEQIGFPNYAHSALYYKVAGGAFPLILVAVARASRLRWPATAAALAYMAIGFAMLWILQLFPATPRLAPVFRPITHMVPPPVPILLVVPAVGIDLLGSRFGKVLGDWTLSIALGLAFLAVLFATQWFAAEFLISPRADSLLFGVQKWDYSTLPGPWEHRFWNVEGDPLTAKGLGIAGLLAVASARLGLWRGAAMARVQR